MENSIRTHVVYMCSSGCGYVERARMWDSPPFGHDGQLRCPDCGGQVWDYLRLTKNEAIETMDHGYSRVERLYRL
jgi:hypothetical protein